VAKKSHYAKSNSSTWASSAALINAQLLFVADCRAVALRQLLSLQLDRAARDLQPTVTPGGEFMGDFFSGPD
jgi:hypothetical protein